MNLRKTILTEHSKSQTLKVTKWVGDDEKRFAEIVDLLFSDEVRIVHRIAWVISCCAINHPDLVKPYFGKFIGLLSNPNLHPAVYRNVLRLLQFIDVPKKYLGTLTNSSFYLLMKSDSPIAVKVFAMTVLKNISMKEPELKRELKMVVEDLVKENGGGIRARGKKILKEISNV